MFFCKAHQAPSSLSQICKDLQRGTWGLSPIIGCRPAHKIRSVAAYYFYRKKGHDGAPYW